MEYVAVFLPSLGVGLVFYLIMRWLLRGDRAERSAQGEAQARRKHSGPTGKTPGGGPTRSPGPVAARNSPAQAVEQVGPAPAYPVGGGGALREKALRGEALPL